MAGGPLEYVHDSVGGRPSQWDRSAVINKTEDYGSHSGSVAGQPFVLLHELGHGLDIGFLRSRNELYDEFTRAFDNAKANLRVPGKYGDGSEIPCNYALYQEKRESGKCPPRQYSNEYFTELTEAIIGGENDHWPHSRKAAKEGDIDGYKAISKVWGVKFEGDEDELRRKLRMTHSYHHNNIDFHHFGHGVQKKPRNTATVKWQVNIPKDQDYQLRLQYENPGEQGPRSAKLRIKAPGGRTDSYQLQLPPLTSSPYYSTEIAPDYKPTRVHEKVLGGDTVFLEKGVNEIAVDVLPWVTTQPRHFHIHHLELIPIDGRTGKPHLADNRLATLTDGVLKVTEDMLADSYFPTLAHDVDKVQLWGDRIGILVGKRFYVKQGGIHTAWQWLDISVSDFQLINDRIILLKKNGKLMAKQGDLDVAWSHMTSNVKKFEASGHRISVIDHHRKLLVKAGGLNGVWRGIAVNVDDFGLSKDIVAYRQGKEVWAFKGGIYDELKHHIQVHKNAIDFKIGDGRIVKRHLTDKVLTSVAEGRFHANRVRMPGSENTSTYKVSGGLILGKKGGNVRYYLGPDDTIKAGTITRVHKFDIGPKHVGVIKGPHKKLYITLHDAVPIAARYWKQLAIRVDDFKFNPSHGRSDAQGLDFPDEGSLRNLSINRPASQSSNWSNASVAANAVDGATGGDIHSMAVARNGLGWWEVKLARSSTVNEVVITGRHSHAQSQSHNIQVKYLDANSSVIHTSANLTAAHYVGNVATVNDVVRDVHRIKIERTTGNYLTLDEVEVWGQKDKRKRKKKKRKRKKKNQSS